LEDKDGIPISLWRNYAGYSECEQQSTTIPGTQNQENKRNTLLTKHKV
jgi:hypothetical protein